MNLDTEKTPSKQETEKYKNINHNYKVSLEEEKKLIEDAKNRIEMKRMINKSKSMSIQIRYCCSQVFHTAQNNQIMKIVPKAGVKSLGSFKTNGRPNWLIGAGYPHIKTIWCLQ